MPKEVFFDSAVPEGFSARQAIYDDLAFAVTWGHGSGVTVAGVPLDESGVDRLLAVLRRAKRQAHGEGLQVEIGQIVTSDPSKVAEMFKRELSHGASAGI